MIAPLQVIVRPRGTLAALAGAPGGRSGALPVVATGVISALLSAIATLLEPRSSRTGGLILAAALPVLFLGFWAGSGWMIAGAARAMGSDRPRRDHLQVSAQTFPVLIAYAVIAVGQAAALRWWGGTGSVLSDLLGLLALPLLMWFLALSVIAAEAVFEVSMLAAIALALLPYAALSAALLLLTLVFTVVR